MPALRTPTNFSGAPLVFLATAFALGVLAGNFLAIDLYVLVVAAVLACAIAIAFRGISIGVTAVVLGFVAAGSLSLIAERQSVSPDRIRSIYDGGRVESASPVEIEGVLSTFPEAAFEGSFLTLSTTRLSVRGEHIDTSGRVRVFVPRTEAESGIARLVYGSSVRVACHLQREDEYRNPGVTPRREILDRQGIDATCSVKSAMLVEHIADESVFIPLAFIYRSRADWVNIFRENLNARAAGVLIASLLGNKNFLDRETAELFRDGGTFHILVISGLHITFIGGVLYFVVTRLTRNRWARFLIVNSVLASYTIAVGADVPVLRAAVMFAVISFGAAIFRQHNLINSLAGSALFLLVWRPSDLFNPSFQLTLVSVAAIVAVAFPLITKIRAVGTWMPESAEPFPPNVGERLKRLAETLYWNPIAWKVELGEQVWSGGIAKRPHLPQLAGTAWQRTARYLFEGVTVSLIVQIAMLPLLIVYFHRASFSAVVLNIWVGIFIAVESFAAVVGAGVLQVSSAVAGPFFTFTEMANAIMLALPRLIASDGMMRLRVPAYIGDGRIVYALFYIPLVALTYLLYRWDPFELKRASTSAVRARLVPAVASLLILFTIIVGHPLSEPALDGRLRVDFFDVGQGDSAFVTFPDGTTMLIDGGGRGNYRSERDAGEAPFEPDVQGIGELVVSQVLWGKGYSHVDYLVATHADADHIQGFTDVASNFSIGGLLVERSASQSEDFASVDEIVRSQAIPVRFLSEGDAINIGGALVEVLSPGPDDLSLVSKNDRSLVITITYGERAFLFTGDIERAAEARLAMADVDVVKVAHHGSRTSSSQQFIDAARPEFAIISVGRRSRFGHPHREVVERWSNAGVTLLQTGTSGMITVTTDGSDLTVSSFK